MKIALAQISSKKGAIKVNITHHLRYIESAIKAGADLIIFPELSITGYEPHLAKQLVTQPNDPVFNDFQDLSDAHNITLN